MSLIDWILLGAVILQAIVIPIVHLNGFKSGMLIQYEKINHLPPMGQAVTLSAPTINSNGKDHEVPVDPYYTELP